MQTKSSEQSSEVEQEAPMMCQFSRLLNAPPNHNLQRQCPAQVHPPQYPLGQVRTPSQSLSLEQDAPI